MCWIVLDAASTAWLTASSQLSVDSPINSMTLATLKSPTTLTSRPSMSGAVGGHANGAGPAQLGRKTVALGAGRHPGAACGRARGHKKGRPKGRLGGTGPGGGEAPAAFDRRFTLFAGWRSGNRNRLPIARYLSQQESRPARPAHS